MKRTLLVIALLVPLHATADPKAPPRPTPPAKLSDVDFARLQLAQSQMNDADKAYALAQHAQADAQRTYHEAQQRMGELLARYGVKPEDLQQHAVTIGDDGTIKRGAPARTSKN